MIKVQGFGRRNSETSHAECIAHHRNIHSKLGLGQADHMGKYVLYYFREAFGFDGTPIEDFPWDMSALEWFRDDAYWTNFQDWLENAPDGQDVKLDEASFLDRDKCYLCPYDENVLVHQEAGEASIDLVRLLSFAPGISPEAGHRHHAIHTLPTIRQYFGTGLRKLVVNTITEATRLSSGRIPEKPIDIVEIYKIDGTGHRAPRDIIQAFAGAEIRSRESEIFSAERSFNLLAEEVVFIP